MQVIDSLDMGGAEKVAVNLANLLPRDQCKSYLCVTRRGGPLLTRVEDHVGLLILNRRGRFDLAAVRRLVSFASREGIDVFHAHGSSLFIAQIAAMMQGKAAVVWHDHCGKGPLHRSAALYRLATRNAGVIAVNRDLLEWARNRLRVPADRLWYVPNWVEPVRMSQCATALPGKDGRRVVCVANLRGEKDHVTLLRALARVKDAVPDVHLLLAGAAAERQYEQYIHSQIDRMQLAENVTCLGAREDVASILRESDIGVLSSEFEGLPLALLEYARAGLPVVATDVGQCREVLDSGRVGFLVPRRSPEPLAEALIRLLASPELRAQSGAAFREFVAGHFSPEIALRKVMQIYHSMLV